MTRLFVLGWLVFVGFNLEAQLRLVNKLKLHNITHASADRLGNFYFVTPDGRINKYDPQAKLLARSAPNSKPLTLLEAWNPLEVFAYYAGDTTYQIFDYNLELLKIKRVDPSWAITPALVCPGNVPNLWILDIADYSLKKVNLQTNTVMLEAALDSVGSQPRFDFMREYQNYLFLGSPAAGIRIFNILGKSVYTIPTANPSYFNFLGAEVFFRDGEQLALFDLYTAQVRKVAVLQNPNTISYTIISDQRVVVVRKNGVEFYEYKLP